MMLTKCFLLLFGGSYGFLSAAGVFTVLAAVGLVPRFAGRTHTAGKIYLYEEMVIWGSIAGCLVSVFPEHCALGYYLQNRFPQSLFSLQALGQAALVVVGLFSGLFIGCLALAIAEMLDSIPIFTRRVFLRRGLSLAVASMALGKLAGSLFYFWSEFHRTAG